ncbi:uncharacterized protein LOC122818165 [Drosophila biarmipes]|nr:uncharacterized protein LOC122818165 [Drosophila biarmipes]
MRSIVKIPFILLCFLIAAAWAQDVRPEIPEDIRPTTTTTTTETPTSTTEPPTSSTEPTTSTTEPITSTTEPTTSSTEPTTSTSESTTTSTTKATSTTESIPTTTTESNTTIEITTNTTTEPNITTTTERKPLHPTHQPPHVRPTSTPQNSRLMQPLERCFLRNKLEYITGWPYPSTINCYRCCYYYDCHLTQCSNLHQGACSQYDFEKLKVHVNWKQV